MAQQRERFNEVSTQIQGLPCLSREVALASLTVALFKSALRFVPRVTFFATFASDRMSDRSNDRCRWHSLVSTILKGLLLKKI